MEKKMVVIRTYSAGVFAGELVSFDEATSVAKLNRSRRLWYWDGAASLSQLAMEGVSKPQNCKFPLKIEGEHTVCGVIEIIPMTEKAVKSIEGVPVWKL